MLKLKTKGWFWGLVLCSMSFAALSCRSSLMFKKKSSSRLQGVYDGQYLLRLSEIPNTGGLYRFEVCRDGGAGTIQAGSCVSAFRDHLDKDITLSLEVVGSMALSDDEQKNLSVMIRSWENYQASLQDSLRGQGDADPLKAAVVTSGLILGQDHTVELSEAKILHAEDQSTPLSEVHGQLTEIQQQLSEEQGVLSRILEKNKTLQKLWYDNFGEASEEEVQKKIQDMINTLISHGYAPDQEPDSVLDEEQQALLERRGHIFSDKFFDFLRHQISQHQGLESEGSSRTTRLIDHLETLWRTSGEGEWDEVVHRFLQDQENDFVDMIDDRFLGGFFEFNRIDNIFLPFAVLKIYNINQVNKLLLNKPSYVLKRMTRFARHKGVPPSVLEYMNKVSRFKEVLESVRPSALAHRATRAMIEEAETAVAQAKAAVRESEIAVIESAVEAVGARPAIKKARLAVNKSKAALKVARGAVTQITRGVLGLRTAVALVALVGSAVSTVVLRFTGIDLRQAKSKTTEVKMPEDFLIMLDRHSALMNTEDSAHVSVPSVLKMLESFSLWQRTLWVDDQNTGIVIQSYCVPQALGRGAFASQCYDVSG